MRFVELETETTIAVYTQTGEDNFRGWQVAGCIRADGALQRMRLFEISHQMIARMIRTNLP